MRRRWNPNGTVASFLRHRLYVRGGVREQRRAQQRLVDEFLASPQGEIARQRVRRGAAWLAKHDPLWREHIKAAVNRGAREPEQGFDLSQCQRCAVGSTVGWDWQKYPLRNEAWVAARAFDLPAAAHSSGDIDLWWAAYEQAWVDLVYSDEEV